jgi:hypothetical protein
MKTCFSRSLIPSILGSALALALGACFVQPPPQTAQQPAYGEPAPGYEAAEPGGQAGAEPGDYTEAEPGSGLRQHPPVTCSGNREIVLEGVHISAPDVAVDVVGNCDIVVTGSHIVGGRYGVLIRGNGEVKFHNSTVEGGEASYVIMGNGAISAQGTRFVGQHMITGNGDFQDKGNNTWQ